MPPVARPRKPDPAIGETSLAVSLARVVVLASSMLAAAGTLVFVIAGLAHGQGSDVVAALVFGAPACALLLFAARRLQGRNFLLSGISTFVAGVLMVAVVILAGVSASYADPCFEVARCKKSPTFAYIALTGATVTYVLAGFLSLVVGPVATGLAAAIHRDSGPL